MRVLTMISVFAAGVIATSLALNIQSSRAADDTVIGSFNDENVTAALQDIGATGISSGAIEGNRFVRYNIQDRKYRAFYHDCTGDTCLGLEVSALFTGTNIPLEAFNKYNVERIGGKAIKHTDDAWSSVRFVIATNGITRGNLAAELRNHAVLTDLLLEQLRGAALIASRGGPVRTAFSDRRTTTVPGQPAPVLGTQRTRFDPSSINVMR